MNLKRETMESMDPLMNRRMTPRQLPRWGRMSSTISPETRSDRRLRWALMLSPPGVVLPDLSAVKTNDASLSLRGPPGRNMRLRQACL